MANDVYRLCDFQMLRKENMQIYSHHVLCKYGLLLRRFRALASSAVVWHHDMVSSIGDWSDHTAELVPRLWKAVDEQDGTFLRDLWWWPARDIMDLDPIFPSTIDGVHLRSDRCLKTD